MPYRYREDANANAKTRTLRLTQKKMTTIELGSIIGPNNKNQNPDFQYEKMVKYNNQAKSDSKYNSNRKALMTLRVLASKLGIDDKDDIIKEAMKTYNKIFRLKMIKGRSIELAVIVSLYHSCRLYNHPISIERLVEQSNSKYTIKQVEKYYRKIVTSFEHDIPIHVDLEEIAKTIMNKLVLEDAVYRSVLGKLRTIEENNIQVGNRTVFIVALIYLVSKEGNHNHKITQTALSKATGISQKSISMKCKHIREYINSYHIDFQILNDSKRDYVSVSDRK